MASLPRTTPKSHPPRLKADARRAESRGRTTRAIALLEEVLRQTPEDWPAVQRLADLRAREGSTRRAIELYQRLAEHYENDDHLARAIAVWRIVLRHDPDFVGAHVKLGELYDRQGFRAESRRQYEAAVEAYEGQGRSHEASLARRALDTRAEAPVPVGARWATSGDGSGSLSPDQEELVAERLLEARMYRRYHLPKQARAALKTVLGMVPDHAEALAELAELEREERAGDLLAAVEDEDLESLGFAIVLEDESTGDESGAAPAPEAAAAGPGELVVPELFVDLEGLADPAPGDAAGPGPEDQDARYDLGIAYREMGLLDEAIAELQLASRDPGRLVGCASLLAACFLEKGLPALAVRWLERGLAGGAPSDEARHALQYELGHALEAAGEAERALQVFTELYGEAAGHRDVAARVERLRGRCRRTSTTVHVEREG